MSYTKRDLQKIGIVNLNPLDSPIPSMLRCRCELALRTLDDGKQFNRVVSFDVLGEHTTPIDPFAPSWLKQPQQDNLDGAKGRPNHDHLNVPIRLSHCREYLEFPSNNG